ncbi:MAG: hypothetical protein M3R44_06075 [Candidatus Eremiobacteraeota bacterium]|nr:hypothetical protein [Candidatus Eremiobacteraeota bacterium]
MGPRVGLSSVLILGAIVLLVAIAVGNGMGNRVLGQVAGRVSILSATPLPVATPSPGASDNPKSFSWKHRQVISVATDPAFPDPRVTPEPTPVPTAPPTLQPTPKPTRRATRAAASPRPQATERHSTYTSPPMLYPMATHSPLGAASPQASGSPVPSSPATRILPTRAP